MPEPRPSGLPQSGRAGITHATIVGIDCAVSSRNVGLALAHWSGQTLQVDEVVRGSSNPGVAEIVNAWISERPGVPVLLALDAPLGWPEPMSRALADHRAGEHLPFNAHKLFRRATDDFVKETVGKRSLDVGADRIARTGYAALQLLERLRELTGSPIPLPWLPNVSGISAIEVYPAATLLAHGFQTHAYKHAEGGEDRTRIMEALATRMNIQEDLLRLNRTSDEVDAVVCLLAARDFLQGDALPPTNAALSEKEGWIWVRSPVKSAQLA